MRSLRLPAVLLLPLLALLPLRAQSSDGDDEEMISLSAFSVSSDRDDGYNVSSALAGLRMATNLVDPNSAAQVPTVPVTLTKRADALAVSFALANSGDKQDKRNGELYASLEALRAAVERTPGLHFEHREIRFAGGNRSKLASLTRSAGPTSYAAVLILADLGDGIDVVQTVKRIRDTVTRAPLDGQTRLVDGVVGLYLRNPEQYRREVLARIVDDLDNLKKSLGPEFEILPSGLNQSVHARICSETDLQLWIDYSFTIRSVRELTAPARKS